MNQKRTPFRKNVARDGLKMDATNPQAHTQARSAARFESPLHHTSSLGSTKGPSWGYLGLVLGAIGSFLSTFGENRLRFLKNMSKLSFEYPHEGPGVVAGCRQPVDPEGVVQGRLAHKKHPPP